MSSRKLWLLVAERIDIRIDLADDIILRALLPIIISLPLIAAIVWLVVGNGLSLIGKLANELRGKRADDLTRLGTTNPPVELAPVVDAINGLSAPTRRVDTSVSDDSPRTRRMSCERRSAHSRFTYTTCGSSFRRTTRICRCSTGISVG